MTKGALKIGDLAAAVGLTTQAVRYYEELGLLAPGRTPGGTRIYGAKDVDRLRTLQRLVRLDIPLATLGELARATPASPTGAIASRRAHTLLDALAAVVEEKRRRYEALSAELATALAILGQCFDCAQPPTAQNCRACAVGREPRPPVLEDLIWP